MTGYRSGFVAAPATVIAALRKYRPSVGTAPQEFVQRASIAAWSDEAHVERAREAYRRKRHVLLDVLGRRDWRVPEVCRATMYLWVAMIDADALVEALLARGVLVSPGTFFGPSGEGYVRFALVPTLEECERAARIIQELP